MKEALRLIIILSVFCLLGGHKSALAVTETINITCWEGYADKAAVDAFKSLVKDKYQIDVEVKPTMPIRLAPKAVD